MCIAQMRTGGSATVVGTTAGAPCNFCVPQSVRGLNRDILGLERLAWVFLLPRRTRPRGDTHEELRRFSPSHGRASGTRICGGSPAAYYSSSCSIPRYLERWSSKSRTGIGRSRARGCCSRSAELPLCPPSSAPASVLAGVPMGDVGGAGMAVLLRQHL